MCALLTGHSATPRRRGFTLLELAVVLVLLSVIAGLSVPTFAAVTEASRERTALLSAEGVVRGATALATAGRSAILRDSDLAAAAADTPDAQGAVTYSASGSNTGGTLTVDVNGQTIAVSVTETGTVTLAGAGSPTAADMTALTNDGTSIASFIVTVPGSTTSATLTAADISEIHLRSTPTSQVWYYVRGQSGYPFQDRITVTADGADTWRVDAAIPAHYPSGTLWLSRLVFAIPGSQVTFSTGGSTTTTLPVTSCSGALCATTVNDQAATAAELGTIVETVTADTAPPDVTAVTATVDGNGDVLVDVTFNDAYAGLLGITPGDPLSLNGTVSASLASDDPTDSNGDPAWLPTFATCTATTATGTPASGTVRIVCTPSPEVTTAQGTWYLQSLYLMDRLYNSGGPGWSVGDSPVVGTYAFGALTVN